MAKVIFEFNRMEDVEFQKKGGFFVGMSVQLKEQSPKAQIGPHDVMAGIIKSMAPEIIEKSNPGVVEVSQRTWARSRRRVIPV